MDTERALDNKNANDHGGRRPGVVSIFLAIVLAIVNGLFAYMMVEAKAPQDGAYFLGYAVGYVLGAVVLWQGIVITLFRIGRRFRNPKSAVKIYCWISVIVLLSLMVQFGAMLPKP